VTEQHALEPSDKAVPFRLSELQQELLAANQARATAPQIASLALAAAAQIRACAL
jgi:hypothetical protein